MLLGVYLQTAIVAFKRGKNATSITLRVVPFLKSKAYSRLSYAGIHGQVSHLLSLLTFNGT